MQITKVLREFQRKLRQVWDMEHIQNIIFNESAGAQKNFDVEPVIAAPYVAGDQVAFGSYIKIAAGPYDVDCVGKAHDANVEYRLGDLVTSGTNVYVCSVAHKARAFDDTPDTGLWKKVAPKTITGIPVEGVSNVTVGKYHNSISVAGWLIDDESTFSKVE